MKEIKTFTTLLNEVKKNLEKYNNLDLVEEYTCIELIDDEMLKINLVPLIVKSRSSSTNKFIKDNQGNIFLLSESKILDDDCIAIQML